MDSKDFLNKFQGLMIDNKDLATEDLGENIYFSNSYASVIGIRRGFSGDSDHIWVVSSNEDNLRRTISTIERQAGINFNEGKPW